LILSAISILSGAKTVIFICFAICSAIELSQFQLKHQTIVSIVSLQDKSGNLFIVSEFIVLSLELLDALILTSLLFECATIEISL